MALIRLSNVTVQFPIYNSKSTSLRNNLMRISTGGRVSKDSSNVLTVTALDNVCIELNDGDTVGLVGHNGAGKSTLLRTIAGIYSPDQGVLQCEGSVSTIFELGAGMEPDLSGYENIIRIGLLLGCGHKQIDELIPDIEKFTELGNFLAMPVRTYSSGMVMRLMFAMATSVRPEILLVDEMFSTVDAEFQKKAEKRMSELIYSSKIFIFASHSKELINKFCKRIFYCEHGKVIER